MAERRMFAKTIIDSDAFLDMPITARLLYYDLAMRGDDDGFINSPKKIQRMIGASEDDLKILIAKKFIIPFENGIVVIKHWRIHNYIRKDTYNETTYKDEKSLLIIDENKSYKLSEGKPSTKCPQTVDDPSAQVRLGKVSIGKVSIGKDNKDTADSLKIVSDSKIIGSENLSTKRRINIIKCADEYGIEAIHIVITNSKKSKFITENKHLYNVDWIFEPDNFVKVLDGRYNDEEKPEKVKGLYVHVEGVKDEFD